MAMECLVSNGLLDELDGLNPTRALILQAYYALRRTYPPTQIGTRQIAQWIKLHEPDESFPSDSLILLTLRQAQIAHRPRGRPRHDRPTPVPAPPFLLPRRLQPHDRLQP
jgi:hypothetical protein